MIDYVLGFQTVVELFCVQMVVVGFQFKKVVVSVVFYLCVGVVQWGGRIWVAAVLSAGFLGLFFIVYFVIVEGFGL